MVKSNGVGFLWGSATSAYQVEGGNIWSDWHFWEKQRGLEQCGQAVRHYEKFAEDFTLAKQLGQNAHRFSMEWARIETAPGQISQSEIEHYRQVIKTLKSLNLKICLTLHHFTLPQWLANQGGWENNQAIQYFKRYVQLVVKEFGSDIDLWVTINEPLVLATEGYLYGHWPPQIKSYRRMIKVVNNLAQAHQEAYKIIHEALPQVKVGLAHNFFSLEPYRRWFILDEWATIRADNFWNKWLMKLTTGSHDFIGVNYYFHQRVLFSFNWSRGFVAFADPKKLNKEISSLGWEVYPSGLGEVLLTIWQRYHLPLYVTENGIDAQSEAQRASFITRSVAAVKQAQKQGAEVKGYFYWSLLDNFEWDKGYQPKFGLIEVDRKTFVRTPRESARVYAEICSDKI
ncbi:MAG: hypothetical protein A2588_01380 [Candidatus Veblenbacteria bacterium RIFOXYD1_FULL_43_11]|uniref:Beta-glucosidase n=1 Tax=Candidatus Veblenbacteria bacterium RIFOXYD1_FULL_43_11 TaxID=1802429 RepID=A0A1G2QAK0_9BACT|nr:MAG: hypothetical protein A2588_01380 [Candidatus Veblenbacteria bacterium RIFOXYD1_FULL_43_11]